jgi:phosphoesterase RecJ-like protein
MTVQREPSNIDVAETARILAAARRVLHGTHRNPDGDAVGSVLGLAHVLRGRGAEVVCHFPEGVPEAFRFLAGAGDVVGVVPPGPPFDLAVTLDCGDTSVLHRAWPGPDRYRDLLAIDHHPVRRPFGTWTLRQPAACVGEIVFRVAEQLGWKLDRELAEAVYVSLVADTGFFRYSSVTPASFELAAKLLAAGVSPWKVAYHVDENYPAARLTMLGEVLGTLRLAAGGAVAAFVVPPGLLERLGLGTEHLENVINLARGIRGVEVSAQLRVNEDGKVRVSLRSRGRVDVAKLARAHAGGGHRNASGCTLDMPLPDAVERILADASAAVTDLGPLDPGDESFWNA